MKTNNKKFERAKKLSFKYEEGRWPVQRLHPGEWLCDGTVYEGTKNKLYTGVAKKNVKAMKKKQKYIKVKYPLNIHAYGERINGCWVYLSYGLMRHDSGETRICFK